MFGFHQRSRSLIPVRDMEKMERMEEKATGLKTEEVMVIQQEAEEDGMDLQTPGQKRNMIMIYLLFLAEAIMASSLSSQIAVLVPSNASCITADTSFLRSILECSYYFGSVAGIFWGRAADKMGRRKVALIGLTGMSSCCLTMGFARTFAVFAALRFTAGVISSATAVAGLSMLADVTHGSKIRTKIVARLPVIAVCGSIGPLSASGLRKAVEQSGLGGILGQYPGLASQVACAGLVFAVAVSEALMLEETLPSLQRATSTSTATDRDSEKAAFLTAPRPSTDSLNITIIEALADSAAHPLPSRLSTYQLLTAPSVSLILASYALLSLHASTFEILLPHLGHTAGLGIPCAWLQPIMLAVKVVAAVRILRVVPFVVEKVGLLPMYRRMSMAFPVLYAVVPLIAMVVNVTSAPPVLSAILSTVAMLIKTTLAGAAKVLVLLLIMSAAPDASSTGSVVGVVSIAELFKALAVAVSGLSYYLSSGYSAVIVNGSLWASLCAIALAGVAVTWRVRETPRVGTDIPEECLVWEDMFDSESDDGRGF